MIDRVALLATLGPVVSTLEDDIRERVLATPELAGHLEREHGQAVAAERTAMALEEWREGEITQAAVAWVLACVFVRFLEDNQLIDRPLISGSGERRAAALGRREEHFRAHPEHSDREYLESCFRVVAGFPAVAPLYDERHNPLWRLGPTADGARALRETFAAIDPDSGELAQDFADPQLGTRFLGDLYQDLSESAKKRYALLQTPDFVERFILDRTLEPAIDEFGLEEVRLIDPTCGSGHFLIGAFERLFAKWQDREPGTPPGVLAQRALDAVYGVDLNPYATAIARFRLMVAALRACGIRRLTAAPPFTLNLATGDSLLHGAEPGQFEGFGRYRQGIRHVFESEDAVELQRILGQGYHAVVGNPPYIVGEDDALRAAYRKRYKCCHREFALTVPFMERFFDLGRPETRDNRGVTAGFIGKITGNNFMKREFGVPLVERFLPSVDVQVLVDTAGAHIPGHGTPTVMLFGRSRAPVGGAIRIVEGLQGEPGQPADSSRGLVWTSILDLIDLPDSSNDFVRVSDVSRSDLGSHPMILGPGRLLKAQLERGSVHRVKSIASDLGYTGQTNIDDMMLRPAHAWLRAGVEPNLIKRLAVGDAIRDWHLDTDTAVWFPYREEALVPLSQLGGAIRALWPWRTTAWERRTFAKTSYRQAGRPWHEWHQIALRRHRTPLTLAWAFVATHNHFALDRGNTVFKQSAPFIKLPEDASAKDHLELAATLNSSTACFWLKQVAQNRGSTVDTKGARQRSQVWEDFYEIPAGRLADFPLTETGTDGMAEQLDALAGERGSLLRGLASLAPDRRLKDQLADLRDRDALLTRRMISLQEEVDWRLLRAYGLVSNGLSGSEDAPSIDLGQRAFEVVLARQVASGQTQTTWFKRHGSTPITEPPESWPAEYRDVVLRRIELIENDPDVGLIERPEHKRRWARQSWEDRQREALIAWVLDTLDDFSLWRDVRLRSTAELADVLRGEPRIVEALELLAGERDADLGATVQRLVLDVAAPHLAALRLTERGLRKRHVWERVWELQREEDRIDSQRELPDGHPDHLTEAAAEALKAEQVGDIPVPPRYAQADFRASTVWRLRGKLDVPKERFVSMPGAERGADPSPVIGWAGWDERDLARALAGRIHELRAQEGTDAEHLLPLLAGVLELLPWIHQWHPDPDPLYGGTPGRYFEDWLDGQLAELAVTRETLRAWRPPAPTRGRRRATVMS